MLNIKLDFLNRQRKVLHVQKLTLKKLLGKGNVTKKIGDYKLYHRKLNSMNFPLINIF